MVNKKFSYKGQSGFTIVELLIVIVVIGILAAITIVAYGGITARANTAKAQSSATNVVQVVEAYNADPLTSGYPSLVNLTGYSALSTSVAKYPAVIAVGGTGSVTAANGTTNILYIPKGTTGGCVGYWSFNGTIGLTYMYAGDATTSNGTTCT
ncbi:MAG: type II secretion system protein [Candidatus Saccharibacteria bacterium]